MGGFSFWSEPIRIPSSSYLAETTTNNLITETSLFNSYGSGVAHPSGLGFVATSAGGPHGSYLSVGLNGTPGDLREDSFKWVFLNTIDTVTFAFALCLNTSLPAATALTNPCSKAALFIPTGNSTASMKVKIAVFLPDGGGGWRGLG